MTQLSVSDFLDVVERSGLVDKTQLSQTLSALETQHGLAATDTQSICSRLAEVGLLTDWQGRQLLEGRCHDFFVGKYKLLDHLGTGGMGSVYLAEHVVMRRQVAIKVLAARRVRDASYLGRFHREARAVAALDHPNIVRAFDVDNDGDIHYLVMEYVPGRDLHSIVQRDGPLDFAIAADVIRQAAEGLAHAHRAGVVHRDIKPANLLIDAKRAVRLLDLGLARMDDDDEASLTRQFDEKILGTVDFLAPEQAFDSHLVDARADIYSLGCTLYFALTGHPPFPTGTPAQRVMLHQTRQPKPLERERPGTPPQLAAICRRMMAKSPSERYATAGEVSAALAEWLERRAALCGDAASRALDDEPLALAPLDDEPTSVAPRAAAPPAEPSQVAALSTVLGAPPPKQSPPLSGTATGAAPELFTSAPANDWLADLPQMTARTTLTTAPQPRSRGGRVRPRSVERSRWESPWFLIGVGTLLGLGLVFAWLVVRAIGLLF